VSWSCLLLQHWVYRSNGSYCCCTTKITGLVLVFLSAMLDLVLNECLLFEYLVDVFILFVY